MPQVFSLATQGSILRAQQLAREVNCGHVEEAHLFLGVLQTESDENGVVETLLAISGVTPEEARLYALSAIQTEGQSKGQGTEPIQSSGAKQILRLAAEEAARAGSAIIGNEHVFIACVRQRRGAHVGEVLRPLGLDAARLREHLRALARSEKPYRAGSPLNHLAQSSKAAIEAAHAAMRISFCGQISTAHLLLGVLDDANNVAAETLRESNVNVEELKREVRAAIFNDGQIATPQKKFSPAAKRALERAKKEADECDHSFIGPQHLLSALLPRPMSVQEKLAFGSSIDDPLERVWSHWPVAEIKRHYEKRWKQDISSSPLPEPTEDDLTEKSKKALQAAHTAMRATDCGYITTTHLLLGLLSDTENFALDTLHAAKVDTEQLKREAFASIHSDGRNETSQKTFSPAAKRAFARAKAEAKVSGHLFIGPHHLLYALLPHLASKQEKDTFGNSISDPLEQVWSQFPVEEIQRQYEKLWLHYEPAGAPAATPKVTPANWIKADWRWTLAGVCWWLWLFLVGPTPFLLGFGVALVLAITGEVKKNYLLRDRSGSFCLGLLLGILLAILFPIF